MTRLYAIFAACFAVFMLVGCGSTESPTAGPDRTFANVDAADLPADKWQEIKLADFSIKLPKEWQTMDLTRSDLEDYLKKAGADNPQIKNLEPLLLSYQKSGMFKLFAFDLKNATPEFADNMNVLIQDLPSEMPFDEVIKQSKEGLKTITVPGSALEYAELNLPGGKCGRVKYFMNQKNGAANGVDLTGFAYIFLKGKQLCTVTFSSQNAHVKDVEDTAADAMTSFKWN